MRFTGEHLVDRGGQGVGTFQMRRIEWNVRRIGQPTGQVRRQRPSARVEEVGLKPELGSGLPSVGHPGESLSRVAQLLGHLLSPRRAEGDQSSSSIARVFSASACSG